MVGESLLGRWGSIVKGMSKFSASGEDFTPIPQ